MRRTPRVASMLALVLAGCPTPAAPSDAGDVSVDGSLMRCATDVDCSNGVFCDGVERCAPSDPTADARGCASASAPVCAATDRCDETTRSCITGGCIVSDADRDGVRSIACGGADCDDTDPDTFPGHPEVCDFAGHDEDCDPCTVASATSGDGDLDHDGFVSMACADLVRMGIPVCDPIATRIDARDPSALRITGVDCADMDADVRPNEVEACNGRDDNCNGAVDEGTLRTFYPDLDGDGYGAGMPEHACHPSLHYVADDLDCDDDNRMRNPAIRETCNGIDDNCNGLIDDGEVPTLYYDDADADGHGDPTHPHVVLSCTAPSGMRTSHDDCDDASPVIYAGAPELCDGLDDDCSMPLDGAGGPDPVEDPDGDRVAAPGATCSGGGPRDCDETRASVHPGAPELCDGLDDDCDGSIDELPDASRSCPSDLACVAAHCTDTVGLALGRAHGCGRLASGAVACWGDNSFGQLGDGTRTPHLAPAPVVGITDALVVVAAGDGSCAVLASGGVVCWGYAVLRGDGIYDSDALVPVAAALPTDVVTVAMSENRACALRASGGLFCWGLAMVLPSAVPGVDDAVELAVGGEYDTCITRRSGEVRCWGGNNYGEVGDGTVGDARTTPVPIGISDGRQLVFGALHGCALRATGAVLCHGYDVSGEVGDGASSFRVATPTPVVGLSDAVEIAAAGHHTCARRATGEVVCWGEGPLGDGTASSSATPVTVLGVSNAVGIATGTRTACARTIGGSVLCWGDDTWGQLGDGATGVVRTSPVLASVP